MNFDILIMAAGLGKRMKSTIPKPVIPVLDKPMLVHILETISTLDTLPDNIYIITYHLSHDAIVEACTNKIPLGLVDKIVWLKQTIEPLGTGSSVQEAVKQMPNIEMNKQIVILSSDVPMISKNTIQSLTSNISIDQSATILTNIIENPTGYGRIKTNNGIFQKIVEQKDANEIEKQIQVVNTGIYCISYGFLKNELFTINNNNAANEYYLTDLFEILKNKNKPVLLVPLVSNNTYELFNINTQEQLKELEAMLCK
jgi:bifunctional N-acetylglucosamine-1-phosphate-uridyltransferase/glucosamine-1-phosphate-acetyltransferase GlmU-like protein